MEDLQEISRQRDAHAEAAAEGLSNYFTHMAEVLRLQVVIAGQQMGVVTAPVRIGFGERQ